MNFNYTVLFIDDNCESFKDVLEFTAQKKGVELISIDSVDAALKIIKINPSFYDGIILDLVFPQGQIQGEEALKKIKSIDQNIPVLILTEKYNSQNIDLVVGCIKEGAFNYLGKDQLNPELLFDLLIQEINKGQRLRKKTESGNKAEQDLFSPYILGKKEKAFFAFKMINLCMPQNLYEEARQRNIAFEWHRKFYNIFSRIYNYRVNIKLRYSKSQNTNDDNDMQIFLIFETGRNNFGGAICEDLLNDLSTLLQAQVSSDLQPYLFLAVKEKDELTRLITKLDKNDKCTLGRKKIFIEKYDLSKLTSINDLLFLMSRYNGEALIEISLTPIALSTDIIKNYQLPSENQNELSEIKNTVKDDFPAKEVHDAYFNIITKKSKELFAANVTISPASLYLNNGIMNAIGQAFFDNYANVDVISENKDNYKSIFDNLTGIRSVYIPEWLLSIFRFPWPQYGSQFASFSKNTNQLFLPENLHNEGILFGVKNNIGKVTDIHISVDDFRRHLYIMGQTGTGKTTLITTILLDLIKKGEGIALLDPHGDVTQRVLANIPDDRKNDLIVFDPTEQNCPIRINAIQYDPKFPEQQTFIFNELIKIIRGVYNLEMTGGPIFEYIFKAVLFLVMETIQGTLEDVSNAFLELDYLKRLMTLCKNQKLNDRLKTIINMKGDFNWESNAVYVISKFSRFIDDHFLGPVISSKESNINFREIIDNKKILIVRLAKAKLGDEGVRFIGSLIFNRLIYAAYSREDTPENQRVDFTVFLDEFQNFSLGDIAASLSEARKYRMRMVLANQTFGQLKDSMVDSILGNVGNFASFRLGLKDAMKVLPYFSPKFSQEDILNLPNYNCISRLLIDNTPSEAFTFQTIKE